jgi:metal-sulfur cluster biosynthetic enzyme
MYVTELGIDIDVRLRQL